MKHVTSATLARPAVRAGTGIHTGKPACVTLLPAQPGSGIRFRHPGGQWAALAEMERPPSGRSSAIRSPGFEARTVEHLLAAIRACGLTDADIEVEGPEIPVLDGSSLPWLEAMREAGLRHGTAPAPALEVSRPFAFGHGASRYRAFPGAFSLSVSVDYPVPVGRQRATADEAGLERIAAARTFAFESEIKAISDAGMAAGGTLDNAVVIGSSGPLNRGGWRMEGECAAHKALDLVGDLMLAGVPVVGRIEACRPGHEGNRAFLAAMEACILRPRRSVPEHLSRDVVPEHLGVGRVGA